MTDQLATHPRILGLMDRLFEPGFLLSQSQIINILPGEAPQGLHHDDDFYRLPRPRQPLGAATVWATEFKTDRIRCGVRQSQPAEGKMPPSMFSTTAAL